MSELSIKISGQRFDNWNNFKLSLAYNSVASTFAFDGLVLTKEQKQLFKPLSYHACQVYYANELLLTGTIISTSTSIDNNINMGGISGYAKPGILEDCQIPISLYPLQSDGLTLKEIAEKLLKPFGISVIVDSQVDSEMNKKYDKSTADASKSVKDYLCDLAKQRNIVVTHTSSGDLLFTRAKSDKESIATYIEGKPSTKISLSCNGQGLHSEITVQKQATIETDVAGEETIKNNLVTVFRPSVVSQSSGDNDDTANSAKMVRASELRNITLSVETDRWKWYDGKKLYMIKPNEIIEVESPSNFINKRTRFFVESIELSGNQEGVNAVVNCVLPETYSGETPKNIFG
jgi:prophage tail gpP-like protein